MVTPVMSRQNTPFYELIKDAYEPSHPTIARSPIVSAATTNSKKADVKRIFSYAD
jgi:hypothetical protein